MVVTNGERSADVDVFGAALSLPLRVLVVAAGAAVLVVSRLSSV